VLELEYDIVAVLFVVALRLNGGSPYTFINELATVKVVINAVVTIVLLSEFEQYKFPDESNAKPRGKDRPDDTNVDTTPPEVIFDIVLLLEFAQYKSPDESNAKP